MIDGSVSPEQEVAGRAESLLQEKKAFEEVAGRKRSLERQLQEEYDRGVSNPQTFLAFLGAYRDYAVVSRQRDDVWGERGKQDLLKLAIRCQRSLDGGTQERAAFCLEEANSAHSFAEELNTRPDAFYLEHRRAFLSCRIPFPYPEGYKGKKFEEMTEEEWIQFHRAQDQEMAEEQIRKAITMRSMGDAINRKAALTSQEK